MKYTYKYLGTILISVVMISLWLFWSRPQRSDMANYVPAECMAFAEVQSLPDVVDALAANDSWTTIFPSLKTSGGRSRKILARIAAWTGLGPSNLVVFGRAQVAVAVFGIEGSDQGETFNVKPRLAVIIDTHSLGFRTKSVLDKVVGDFATRAYKNPTVKHYESDGVDWTEWIARDGNRHLFSASIGNMGYIGNDEAAVKACLDVRNPGRPNLASMNSDVVNLEGKSRDALAVGYLTPQGTSQVLQAIARVYGSQISAQPEAQKAAASLVPELSKRLTGSVEWATNSLHGKLIDNYRFRFTQSVPGNLDTAFRGSPITSNESDFVPDDAVSVTFYKLGDPAAAWRGLRTALNARLDTVSALLINKLMEVILEPYGIKDPEAFLKASGPGMATAILGGEDTAPISIVRVRDENGLRNALQKTFGQGAKTEKISGYDMRISGGEDKRASAFVDGFLLLGTPESVSHCIETHSRKSTLGNRPEFSNLLSDPKDIAVLTLTSESSFVHSITQPGTADSNASTSSLIEASKTGLYSRTETSFPLNSELNGFDRRTESNLGFFGRFLSQFATTGQ